MESINFVLAYPQAPIKTDIFMTPPKVPLNFEIEDLPHREDRYTKVYKLLQNLYGLKDAGRTWGQFLQELLIIFPTALYTTPIFHIHMDV